jgi:hypothetical protein
MASHTFTSGKLNKLMDLFITQIEGFSALGGHKRSIQAHPPQGALWFGLLDRSFDAPQNELAGRAPFTGGRFMETPVQRRRNVQRSTDRRFGHIQCSQDDLNKSKKFFSS